MKIAIDGPAGAGKSSIAKLVAKKPVSYTHLERTDRDRTGDHRVWCGYLWREETAAAAGKTV